MKLDKKISILGSTGSIGVQTLDAARNLGIEVVGLSANSNIDLLEAQIREFNPKIVSVGSKTLAKELENRIDDKCLEIVYGDEGIKKVAVFHEADTVVTAVVGISGLMPTMEAIRKGKNIALANKETLVAGGNIVMAEAEKYGVEILPVDSEHSAIYQSLMGNDKKNISKIILTASGGPFRGMQRKELENVTLEQALKHPNWSMGNKITIDSATLMNKGLEVIEAKWLFALKTHQIEVVVHPQSIIHSMVEYVDNSIMAQLGSPDMRIPIQFALTYPERVVNNFSKLDFLSIRALTFEKPDMEAFPCLKFAFDALEAGGTMPCAMNAANEIAVESFLNRRIGFSYIPEVIKAVMDNHSVNSSPQIGDIAEVDLWAREEAKKQIEKI